MGGESLKCWEYKNCEKKENCPAYPYNGRMCWNIAGTMCRGKIQGEYAQKIGDCRKCDFYKKVMEESRKEMTEREKGGRR